MGIAGAGGCGTDSEFSDGNGRYDDGQQRGIGGYLGGIAGGFDQCAGDSGVCCAGSRRNHHLFPVHGTEKYKKCHCQFDEKLKELQQEGHIIPSHDMIKTPEQIE